MKKNNLYMNGSGQHRIEFQVLIWLNELWRAFDNGQTENPLIAAKYIVDQATKMKADGLDFMTPEEFRDRLGDDPALTGKSSTER